MRVRARHRTIWSRWHSSGIAKLWPRGNLDEVTIVAGASEKGTCKGELRGEASITSPNVAVYRENGDPCVLQFTFGANAVTMKEVQGCGNYRDIKCFFEGTYPRKKEKPKPAKKK